MSTGTAEKIRQKKIFKKFFKNLLTNAKACDIIQTDKKNTAYPEPPKRVQGKRKKNHVHIN